MLRFLSMNAGFNARFNAQPGELNDIIVRTSVGSEYYLRHIRSSACGKIVEVHGGAASKACDVLWFTTTATWKFKLSAGSSPQ